MELYAKRYYAYIMSTAKKINPYKFLTPIAVFLLSAFFSFTCNVSEVIAGTGLVGQVGGAAFTQGTKQFWVSSTKPTFSGVTTASSAVSGTVGAQTVAATADASGNWSWASTTDLSGDNAVSITSGSTTVSFTLTIGSLPGNVAIAGGSTLAPAGSINPTLIFLGGGTLLIFFGTFGLSRSFIKH